MKSDDICFSFNNSSVEDRLCILFVLRRHGFDYNTFQSAHLNMNTDTYRSWQIRDIAQRHECNTLFKTIVNKSFKFSFVFFC